MEFLCFVCLCVLICVCVFPIFTASSTCKKRYFRGSNSFIYLLVMSVENWISHSLQPHWYLTIRSVCPLAVTSNSFIHSCRQHLLNVGSKSMKERLWENVKDRHLMWLYCANTSIPEHTRTYAERENAPSTGFSRPENLGTKWRKLCKARVVSGNSQTKAERWSEPSLITVLT